MIRIEDIEKEIGKTGRKPNPITYRDVEHNGHSYVVGTVSFKGEPKQFVIDKEDEEKVKKRNWHFASGHYIGSTFYTKENEKKELYLHNYVMNILTFPGKGCTETVDHINRNGLDNRKSNLRILTQAQQNLNQGKKSRRCVLPEGCGIDSSEIPRHIWYIKASGLHGDRFGIDLKTEGIKWKSSCSKLFSLREKLEEAIKKLEELYLTYPYLRSNPGADDSEYKAIIHYTLSFQDMILHEELHNVQEGQ